MVAKELEAAGIPVAFISTLDSLAKAIGANRVIRGKAIPYVVGDPSLPLDQEKAFRKSLVMKALEALLAEVREPTVFA